jgi:Protein of unknown function (DUF1329)
MRTSMPILAVGVAVALGVAAGVARAELHDGDVLDASTWQQAEGLLPEEILLHYQHGEYVNQVADPSQPGYLDLRYPADFRAASEANRGRYALSAEGSIVEASSGEQPAYIFGLPFPDIDPADPQAATRIVWNYFYSFWYNGNSHYLNELVMLNRGGVERRIATDVWTLLFDGAPEAAGKPNPNNLLLQRFARVTSPADLEGTTSLTWRFRDADKHDALWTFVPGLRRARQVSALNRSDGFLGSDLSLDDGDFFDGKPEDFTFRLLERRDQYVFMDPYSIRGDAELLPVPGGGWRILWKNVPRIGADDPDWRGVPWAPVSVVLVRRPTWIIEAIPRDPNYLFGRLVLRIDAETYRGSFASKYDRADQLLTSYQISNGAYYAVDDGAAFVSAGGTTVRTAENFLYDRATVVLFPVRNRKNPADTRIPARPELFTVDALSRMGK